MTSSPDALPAEQSAEKLVLPLVQQCCRELFEAYGLEISPAESTNATPGGALKLCGVLAFTGDVRGTVILAANAESIARTIPAGDDFRSWMAELTNQFVGRLKNSLLRHNVNISIMTPITMRGEHLAPIESQTIPPSLYASEAGTVCFWFECEASPGFSWQAETQAVLSYSEGEALFF